MLALRLADAPTEYEGNLLPVGHAQHLLSKLSNITWEIRPLNKTPTRFSRVIRHSKLL